LLNLNRTLLLPLGVFVSVFAIFAPSPSLASNAGDACTISGAVEREGGQTLICNGSTWKQVYQVDTDGRTVLQVDNDGNTCNSSREGRLSYDSDNDVWEFCDGTSWLPFDQAGCQGPADFNISGDYEQIWSGLV
jgi:hypothetical protein